MGRKLPRYVHQHSSGSYRASVSRRDGRGSRWYGPLRYTPEEAATDAIRFRGVVDPRGTPSLSDGYALLLRDLENSGARPETVDYYAKCWRALTGPGRLPKDRDLLALTHQQVRDYVALRLAEGVSLATAWNKEVGALQRIVRVAKEEGAIRIDPLDGLKRPKIRTRRFSSLTAEQVAAVREAILRTRPRLNTGKQVRDSALVGFLFATGIRRAELTRLKVQDIDFENRTMFIDGKTRHRTIPLEGLGFETATILADGRLPDQALFGNNLRAVEIAFQRIRDAVAAVPELSKLKVSPHRLRHSMASDAVRRGVSPYVLSAILGHSDIRQTMTYYHQHGDQVRDAMRQIGGGAGP